MEIILAVVDQPHRQIAKTPAATMGTPGSENWVAVVCALNNSRRGGDEAGFELGLCKLGVFVLVASS